MDAEKAELVKRVVDRGLLVRMVDLSCGHTMKLPADKRFTWVICLDCEQKTRLGEQDEEFSRRRERS